ncbi:MAG: biotin--[acetyl-CoA-carboxylase] ligase [Lachnospiraceae bacterium]|nr:biotin--[acetyl-CoA-carboxylase] ligase [Lachnospiraceae bacterium]
MKSEILRTLREAGDNFVSGQALCAKAGVTRQAVWKNIAWLRENGFVIESVSNKGYKLVSSPPLIYAADIESRLSRTSICKKVESFDTINSTNTYAKQLAEAGTEEGTLVIAEKQTAGKGRRGRQWESGPGTGIYMSIVLRPGINPVNVPGITLVTALALVHSIKETCNAEPLIKWPNDIVLGGRKICGILTEMSSEMNYINYVVTGIGINANNRHFHKEIEETATSIYLQTGKEVDRAQLAACTVDSFGSYYKKFEEVKSIMPFIEEYNSLLASMDKEVKIFYGMKEDAERTQTGIARGINKDGALIVDTKNGTEYVMSGEVSVRGLYGYI